MKNLILKIFFSWVLITLPLKIIAGPDDSGDSYWGDVSVAEGGTVSVHMSEAFERIFSFSTIHVVNFEWSSYNKSIAQIISSEFNSCTVRGIKKGKVRINCSVLYKVEGAYGNIDTYVTQKGYVMLTVQAPILVGDMSIYPSSIFLALKEQEQLEAFVYPSNATNKNVSWSTSAPEVVIVNSTGLLTAKGYGTATITCSATDGSGVTAICNVTVGDNVPITGITLDKEEIAIGTNSNINRYLYATVSPKNATEKSQKLTCTSSNPDVVWVWSKSLQDDGRVEIGLSAKSEGSAIITCSAVDDSSIKATCIVNVYKYGDGDYIHAKTSEGIDVSYYITDATNRTCRVSSINRNTSGEITIPSEVEGFRVTGIDFFNCHYITKVNLPSSVEEIGKQAFYGCSSLSSIALDNIKHIGENAFKGCTSLSEVTGISKLEYIEGGVFDNTPWYNRFPDGLLYIGKVLYKYKGKMPADTEISVVEGKVSISSWAFSGNGSNLVSIYLPTSMTNLSGESFADCEGLKKIVVADGNETYDSRNKSNAIIESGSNTLIVGCKETIIPESVKAIGKKAFYGYYRTPRTLTIPNTVDSISDNAFSMNNSFCSIYVGSGLRKLGKDAFSRLDSICVSEDNPYFDSRDNCNAIIESSTNKLVVASNSTTIPYSVKTIGNDAFATARNITGIKLHDYVEIIEDSAFNNMVSLEHVTIGRGVKSIGKYAFVWSTNLKTIHSLMTNPPAVDEEAFGITLNYEKQKYDCKEVTLYVPKGTKINYMTTKGWSMFEKIVEIDDFALMDGDRFTDETIEGIELTYQVKDCVSKFCELVESPTTIEGKVSIPDAPLGYKVVGIGGNVFNGHNTERRISEVVIPEGLKEIGHDAFYYVKTLNTVSIPNTVKSIGSWAFANCGLTSLIIPNSVDSISYAAFTSNSLESLTIGSSLRKLVDNPFRYNSKLKSIVVADENPYFDSRDNCNAIIEKNTNKLVTGCLSTKIPSSVKAIGDDAFNSYGSNFFDSMTLSDNVESIGKYAFAYDYSLRSLTIGKNVKEIDNKAFYSCYNLRSIHILNPNPIKIEEAVFGCYEDYADSIYNNATLFVPIGSKPKYMASAVWKKFKTIKEGEPPVMVTSITLNNGALTLTVGETSQLTAEISPENATNKTVTWSSSNTDIVTVSSKGLVTAIAKGSATITCMADDESGVKATSNVTVKALPPTAISIPESASVEVGSTITLTPTFEPANASASLTWSSDDETIATVDSEGIVTGVKKGYTFITVETDNGKYADCKVTVIAQEPTDIKLPSSVSLYIGGTLKLTPTITPESVETTLAWKSDDETVVTVSDDGMLTGIGEGVARVSVSTANGVTSNNCRVKVELDPDGIASVSADGTKNIIFNLSGQRVAAPRKGIYIMGGKKVIVK